MKLYIAVLDTVPDDVVPLVVAHAVLAAHLKFQGKSSYQEWLDHSFKKCIVRVNAAEFSKIYALENVHVGYESTVLNSEYCVAVVCPSPEVPNVLRFAKLWKSSQ